MKDAMLPARFKRVGENTYPEVETNLEWLDKGVEHFAKFQETETSQALELMRPIVENAPYVLDLLHELEALCRRMKKHGMPTELELHDTHTALLDALKALDE